MKGTFAAWGVSCAIISATLCATAFAEGASPPNIGPQEQTTPGVKAPDRGGSNSHGSLSEKLDKTNGVIRPNSAVDPGMEKPAPSAGATPVITPPGGDAGVQPK